MNLTYSTKRLVEAILRQPLSHEWSLQGFGMLRLNMPGDLRLNVWDSRFRVRGVSMMHNHPWHFESLIVAGQLVNIRFESAFEGIVHNSAYIKPGPGGGILAMSTPITLKACETENYVTGEHYQQFAKEIHVSQPFDGTVTLNIRRRVGPDEARVFWPLNSEWVSAEPRPATDDEIVKITKYSLDRWF